MSFRAGSAAVEITPDRPVPLAGTYSERMSTGVHDPLFARALVLGTGDRTIGHLSLDLISAHGDLTAEIRRRVADAVGVDGIMVSTTHTHTGPELPGRHPGRSTAYDLDDVVERIAAGATRAIVDAAERREPASIRVGRATNWDVTINRRSRGGLLGEVDTAGRNVDPDRDVDPELAVLLVEPDHGRPFALYNFACHTTTMTTRALSADWPQAAAARVRADRPAMRVSFVNGAAGDVVPRDSYDWQSHHDSKSAFRATIGAEIGETLAAAIDDAERTDPMQTPTIDAAERTLDVPTKPIDPDGTRARLQELDARIEAEGLSMDRPLGHPVTRERRFRSRDLALHDRVGGTLTTSVQGLRIGPVTIVSLPGEPLVDHGETLKAAMPASVPMIAGYTNDHVGYLPTREEIRCGGYEVSTRTLAAAGIDRLRDTALALSETLAA